MYLPEVNQMTGRKYESSILGLLWKEGMQAHEKTRNVTHNRRKKPWRFEGFRNELLSS
jgi:hypothetical protein